MNRRNRILPPQVLDQFKLHHYPGLRLSSGHVMAESECAAFKKLKDREDRAHAAWTSFLYRNEVKPRLSEKAKRKHQKEEMEAYQQAHKARLAHAKSCPTCMANM
jgi:hypothetical protein